MMPATRSRIRDLSVSSVVPRGPSRSPAPTRRARRWRSRTTRIFRSPHACCRRRCGRMSRRSMPSRAWPTTSPTKARRRRRIARRACAPGRAVCTPRSPADHGRRRRRVARRPDLRRARPLDPLARSAGVAVRRSAERVRSGYHDDSLRLVGRGARLLPPIGESGRPSRAAHRRLPRRGARSIVGRAVHRAAADQLLAGLRPRLAGRPAVCAARRLQPPPARAKTDLAGRALTAGLDARARARASPSPRARFARGPRVCDGVRGRLRFELRLTWLGGRRILDRVDAQRGDSPAPPADARRRRRARPALAGALDVEAPPPDGAQDQLLLLVPRAAGRAAARDHRRLGFLPRRRRCGGRSGADRSGRTSPRERVWLLACGAGALLRRRRAADAAGPAAAAVHRPVRSAARRRSRTSSTASRWISTRRAIRRSTICCEYCRRVASAVGLICIRIFGCREPRRAGLRAEPRRRAAADQYHPRREGRSRARPRLSAARGSGGGRLHGRGSRGRAGVRAGPPAARVRVPARARLLPPRHRRRGRARIAAGWSPPRSCARSISRRCSGSSAAATTCSPVAPACRSRVQALIALRQWLWPP